MIFFVISNKLSIKMFFRGNKPKKCLQKEVKCTLKSGEVDTFVLYSHEFSLKGTGFTNDRYLYGRPRRQNFVFN